ncbi:O-antigen ligase [Blastococcus sp. LR1]|uniref:O-antigen ligase family protein n=1 Tax=Blastococcus sp. LR1 TaxID=2877000 RepID=UPI001CD02465|nr:O-antigen ligase family protein [Blastococcus sp. LR1]MCA0144869.1 O-antigen ligase family protein [Blastococcus sp. LR1]
MLAVLCLAIASMPLVNPKAPGNAAPIDAFMALALFVVFAWALRNRVLIRVPYVVPMAGLVLTGLTAALMSLAPTKGAIAVAQEIFLLLWCTAIVAVCRTPRILFLLMRVWVLSATAWAALLVAAVSVGFEPIVGATEGGGARARLFFDHPNMAGNFFMVTVFIAVAAGYPTRRSARAGAVAVLLLALLMTGSNAALLSLLGGAMVALFLHVRSRSGLVTATATALCLAGGLAAGWFVIGQPLLAAAQQSDNPLLRYSLGRGEASAEGRVDLFASQFELYERGNLLGIGPAGTKEALGASAAQTVKEAHNDYLATLVERGPLGLLALMALVAVIAYRSGAITRRPLPPWLAATVPVPAALVGLCATFALTAVTHEILHYRWFWTTLGLLAAVHLLNSRAPGAFAAADDVVETPGSPPSGGGSGALERRPVSASSSAG